MRIPRDRRRSRPLLLPIGDLSSCEPSFGTLQPDLAAQFANRSDAWRLVRLIGRLRNTIHGAPMSAIGTSGSQRRSLVGIPAEERREVAELADALGGGDPWGLTVTMASAYLEPDRFTERLMAPAIALLDTILSLTD